MSDHDELAKKLPKFDVGQVVATPAAIVAIEFAHISALELLHRHVTGDFGDISDEGKALNTRAIDEGGRILSAYTLADGTRIWLITEADRATSTLLLPEEY